jgi:hypothetical protein
VWGATGPKTGQDGRLAAPGPKNTLAMHKGKSSGPGPGHRLPPPPTPNYNKNVIVNPIILGQKTGSF